KANAEHPTLNIERRSEETRGYHQDSMFDVQCSMFSVRCSSFLFIRLHFPILPMLVWEQGKASSRNHGHGAKLMKVMIQREGGLNRKPLHHHAADAVGEAPVFISPSLVDLPGTNDISSRDMDQTGDLLLQQQL